MMWPFKWNLSACTFSWCYLFVKILENEILSKFAFGHIWHWKGKWNPDSSSCILDSKAQDSGFYEQKFSRISDSTSENFRDSGFPDITRYKDRFSQPLSQGSLLPVPERTWERDSLGLHSLMTKIWAWSFDGTLLGPVVRTPVSANPGLNFNQDFFFFSSKALFRIIFSIPFRASNHQIVGKENLTEFVF